MADERDYSEDGIGALMYNPQLSNRLQQMQQNRDASVAQTQAQSQPYQGDTYVDEYGQVRRFEDMGKPPPSLEQTVQNQTGMQAGLERSTFSPYSAEAGWHVPGVVYDGIKMIAAPEQAYNYGNVTPEDAASFAMNTMGGGFGASKLMRNPTGTMAGKDLGMQIGPNASKKYWDPADAQFYQTLIEAPKPPPEKAVRAMLGSYDQFPIHKNAEAAGEYLGKEFGSKIFREISDAPSVYSQPSAAVSPVAALRVRAGHPIPIPAVLDHPQLYEAYPQLANTKLLYKDLPANEGGWYDHRINTIVLNKNKSKELQHSTLLHEIQHNIQKIEGWSAGSNTDFTRDRLLAQAYPEQTDFYHAKLPEDELYQRFAQKKLRQEVDDQAFDTYQRNQGEASARATQARRHFTQQDLDRNPILYDVSPDQLTPYKAGGTVNSIDRPIKGGKKDI